MRSSFLLLALLTACDPVGVAADRPAPDEQAATAEQATSGQRSDVDIEAFAELYGGDVTLIDVRTDAEYAAGHVPGAVHLPMSEIEPGAAPLAGHDKGEPVYLICQSGGRSAAVADRLAEAGYHAVNVEGGTGAWQASGHPVE